MKKLILLALLGAFFSSNYAYSQYNETIVVSRVPNSFKVGDLYYPLDFRGFSMLMEDIKKDDFELFLKLKPEYDRINKKRIWGIVTGSSSVLLGGAIIGAGIKKGPIDAEELLNNDVERYMPNENQLLAGTGIITIGLIISYLIYPDDKDIFNFVNLHNRNSQKKIDWGLGLHFDQYHDLGMKFTLKF